MITVSNILEDINRGVTANNMVESEFSYRVVYFVNFGGQGEKHYIDVSYDGLRAALENIIRTNLTVTNCIVLAAITIRKDGESISLLSRAYSFSLDEYFRKVCDGKREIINSSTYRRRAQCY